LGWVVLKPHRGGNTPLWGIVFQVEIIWPENFYSLFGTLLCHPVRHPDRDRVLAPATPLIISRLKLGGFFDGNKATTNIFAQRSSPYVLRFNTFSNVNRKYSNRVPRFEVPVLGLFKWRQFEPEMILLAIGWNLRFSLSYRDVEELPLPCTWRTKRL
jgi:hypothetical protein